MVGARTDRGRRYTARRPAPVQSACRSSVDVATQTGRTGTSANVIGDDFWLSARAIVETGLPGACSRVATPYGWSRITSRTRAVPFCDEWRELWRVGWFCGPARTPRHARQAQTVPASPWMARKSSHTVESKSFFRRLAWEKKVPRISIGKPCSACEKPVMTRNPIVTITDQFLWCRCSSIGATAAGAECAWQ